MRSQDTPQGMVAALLLVGCLPELRVVPCRDGATCGSRDRPAVVDRESHKDAIGLDTPSVDVSEIDAGGDVHDASADSLEVCASGEQSCDGQCVSLQNDSSHCGRCGRACDADQRCERGECGFPQRSCLDPSASGCGMQSIPGGTFLMGDNSLENSRPTLPRMVVGPYAMDRYEVTVERFRRYVAAGLPGVTGNSVSYPSGGLPWSGPAMVPNDTQADANCNWSATSGTRERHPVNCVDWFSAQAFCVWDGGRMPSDPLTGRLPSEAEWEFAARGTDDRPYPWGNNPPEMRGCWNRSFSDPPATCLVDDPRFSSGVSPFGIWQMLGNTAEWAADNYAPYNADCWSNFNFTGRNPLCVRGVNDARTIRGTTFDAPTAESTHAAFRWNLVPIVRFETIGFRCVRTR